MAVVTSLELKVSEQSYQQRISTLENYVSQLNSFRDEYEQKNNEVNNFYTGDEANELKNNIKENIAKIDKAIEACKLNIQQLKKIVQENNTVTSDVKSIIGDSFAIAKNLFV